MYIFEKLGTYVWEIDPALNELDQYVSNASTLESAIEDFSKQFDLDIEDTFLYGVGNRYIVVGYDKYDNSINEYCECCGEHVEWVVRKK